MADNSTRELRHATHDKIHEVAEALGTAHHKIQGRPGLLKFEQIERIDLVIAELDKAKDLIDDALASASQARFITASRDFDAYKAAKYAEQDAADQAAEAAEAQAILTASQLLAGISVEDDDDPEIF